MASSPITSWQTDWEKMEIVADFIFLGSKITVDGDYSSVQLLSPFLLFATPWTAACQAFLSITNSRSLLKLMSIGSVMPSNHVILCCPLLLPPSIISSTRVFSSESALCIRMNVSYTSGTQRNYSTCYHSLGQVRESHSQTGCWGCQQLPSPRACWSAWPSVQKFHTFPIHE